MHLSIAKRYSLLFLFLCFACWSTAQNDTRQSILYLKDGSVIYGKLIDQATLFIIWELVGGDQIKVQQERIHSFEKIPAEVEIFQEGHQREKSGYYGIVNIGGLFSKSDRTWINETNSATVNVSVGYRFHPWLAVGVGTGFDNYNVHMVPVFAEIRGDMKKSAITPYYQLALGYGLVSEKSNEFGDLPFSGGWLAHPALGMKFYTRSRTAWLFEFGYRFQRVNRNYTDNRKPQRWTLRRAAVRIGFEF